MSFNVLVAAPHDAAWGSIANGVRRHLPDASILRVKDGEQALRFLFDRGLLTEAPPDPDLVLLSAELPVVSAEDVLAQLREDPRTRSTLVILLWQDRGKMTIDPPDVIRAHERLLRICGDGLDTQVAEAVHRLCEELLSKRRATPSAPVAS